MENPNNKEEVPGNDPGNPKSNVIGEGTNAEQQEIQDQSSPQDNDPSTWPSGDKSLEQLVEEDKDSRVGSRNITDGTGSSIENP